MSLSIYVNGVAHSYAGDGADLTLLELLREELGLTGPKRGCGEGACGACTVLVGSRAVQACQLTASAAAGQRVTTVEGLAEDGVLHPVQQAWLERGAFQCGFCTPGWLTGTASLLARVPHPDDARIAAELAVHACRCCCYPRIRQAVHRAAELLADPDLLAGPDLLADPAVAGASPLGASAAGAGPAEPVAAAAGPAAPRDLTDRQPGSLAAAMPEGLLTVVAGDGDAAAWDAPDEAWVHVGADGSITAFTGKVDAGQGTRTALGLLVAEELAVPPGRVTVTMADTCVSPFDLGTFGSRSMPHAAPPLRTAAAAAFRLLRDTAATRFGLRPDELTAADGMFAGPDGAPVAGYGQLVAGQRRVERVPADAPVTPAAQWRTAGRPVRAAGGLDVVTGAKKFPSDLRLDGMLYGCALHPPSAGARLAAADTSAAATLPGVLVVRDGDLTGVVAPDGRTARRALAAITADWHEAAGPAAADLESWLRARPSDADGRFGPVRHDRGDAAGALAAGPVRVQASFRAAYVAHVPLEPRAALARWDGDRLTVWTATSTPFRARRELAAEFGLPEADVHVLVPDFGGGFGGKHGSAVAAEAARLARAAGRPVRVEWTRADEFTAGYLRPAAFIEAAASADAAGRMTGWSLQNLNSGAAGIMTPYRVPNQAIGYQPAEAPLAQGSYRALAATANNFARESLMDELAAAVGADPVRFRLEHLDHERLAAVLTTAAAEIGWDETEPDQARANQARANQARAHQARAGLGTGIALGTEKDSFVATAARVHVGPDGAITIRSLVTAADCGTVVHPDGLLNQIEGAIMMGLGPALFEQIKFEGRQILNGTMTDYRVPRLADLPAELRVVLVNRTDLPPVGGGETPIIAVAPAIANAIFRACGVRLRSMPLIPAGRVPLG
jgi:CO/xanthine dehydrogenase Mo-binding subunit/aerobic-type carbon monoxide dehydrogenase small subunit (CoxS/CutS family)